MSVTRLVLGYLLATGLVVGVWALFLPESFYADFPGLGRSWVSVDGPYNRHLIADAGAAYLMIAALAGLGLAGRAPPAAVGFATLCFNLPHLLYHFGHLSMYSALDCVLNVAALSAAVLCSAWLVLPNAGARP